MNSILNRFFYPESVCLCGVSSKEKSIGYEILNSIKRYGYTGAVYPVNPKGGEILGYKCYTNIEEITGHIDLAIVMVPKGAAVETVEALLKKDVKAVILITAGFRETGNEGKLAEERLLELVKKAGARMLGPNCMGVISTADGTRLNATFSAQVPDKGGIAFLSQSGAIGAAVLNQIKESGIRFGHFVSAGNKADLSENDFLKYWMENKDISVITMYLESFSNAEELLLGFDNSSKKPLIILKGGRTETGIKAAASHTGALSSNDEAASSLLKQFGILRVNDLNELFNTAKAFENVPLPSGRRTAVITNAGGPGILAADACEMYGLELAELSEESRIILKEFVHPEGSINNPVDLLPGGTAEQYVRGIEVLLSDKNVDSVISIFVEPVMVKPMDVALEVDKIKSGKPVVQCIMPLPQFWDDYRNKGRKPVFRNPEDPAKVLSNLLNYSICRTKTERLTKQTAKTLKGTVYNNQRVAELAQQYELPLVTAVLVKPDKINKQAEEYSYPIVLKGLSGEVLHKSEMNAVKLNIKNKEQLLKAEMEILSSFNDKNIKLEEFMIQPYIKGRYELLIGGFRDPSFGPVIMFGSGGKYVEVFKDTVMRSAYLSEKDIDDMINETKAGKILHGVRGELPIDLKRLKKVIKSAAQMMLDNDEIKEFDFNPMIITSGGLVHGVDVRIIT